MKPEKDMRTGMPENPTGEMQEIIPEYTPGYGAGYVPNGTGELPDMSGYVSGGTGGLPNLSGYMSGSTGELPDMSGYVLDGTGELPDMSGYVSGGTGELPDMSGYVSDGTGELPDMSGYVPDGTGELPDMSGYVSDETGEIPNVSGAWGLRSDLMIRMEDVHLVYPSGTVALKGCSLEVEKGEFAFIVGSSGSGKSTLIRTLLGELQITSGRVEVAGKNLANMPRKELPYFRRKLGVVFQEFRLLDEMTVFENVELAQRVVGVSNRERRRKNSVEMLEMVGLADKLKAYPSELSGGEQQRVAIARAMVNKPSILLADEPTGNLDPENSWEIMRLLQEVYELGTTVLVVSHNEEIVNQMQMRVITLHEGQIVGDTWQGGYVW